MKAGTFTPEFIKEIEDSNPLEDVAKEYGIVFDHTNKAKCPFHNDGKTGNLHIYRESNTYKCFSRNCRAGRFWEDSAKTKRHTLKLPNGNVIEDGGPGVIGFVMNIEQISYPEAVVKLAERAGLSVPAAYVNPRLENMKAKKNRDNIKFCKALLEDQEMLAYLKSRGIKKSSIKAWRLGVVTKDYQHENFGNMLRGRLVFGITEYHSNPLKAKTIAMAYRRLDDGKPKYINDKASEIYNKSEVIYGWNEAWREIRRLGFAIVTEGYVDVIIGHQSEIKNMIATCGTSFTEEQMARIRKHTRNLIFWYDGDGAGWDAMLASIPDLLAQGFRVKIVDSAGMDPAEVMNQLEQDNERIWAFIKDNAKPALQVMADDVISDYDHKMAAIRTEALDELLPLYEQITDPSEKVVFRTMINQRLGVAL